MTSYQYYANNGEVIKVELMRLTVCTTCRKEELGHYEYGVLSSSTITKCGDIIFLREQHHKKTNFLYQPEPHPWPLSKTTWTLIS